MTTFLRYHIFEYGIDKFIGLQKLAYSTIIIATLTPLGLNSNQIKSKSD